MTTASLPELRRAINNIPTGDLPELCIRLARFKIENKELLSYLLFEAEDEPEYIRKIKSEIDDHFSELSRITPYLTKKGVRKALAFTNQRIRYSGQKRTEVELLIYFCKKFQKEVPFRHNITLKNIYLRLLQRIKKTIGSLHEDLQFDYSEAIKALE
ncbi:MAG: hypothetical protein WCJ95_04860 [Mariniphaga sp.]